ncbi:MAG: Crp/Fnr family transcriptional regulator [Rugosibacter sp.]|nr:Crp/Fnr family transcriptional regulator [Rugosibacter sp.]
MSSKPFGPTYFSSLSTQACLQAMGYLRWWGAAPGEVLFQQGDNVPALYFIETGSVICDATLEDGRHMIIGFAMSGDGAFGAFEVFGGTPAACTATTYSAVTGWHMPAAQATMALEQIPGFANLITRSMARAASTFQHGYIQAVLREPHELIAMALLSATQPLQKVNQTTLAKVLGLTRQCVNKHLRQWAASGLVEIGYAGVRVVDREALKQVLQT